MTLPDHLTDDAFLGGALHILQPKVGFRSGLDAVLLAAAAPVEATRGSRVLDAGSGVGVVGLSIAKRLRATTVTLVELNEELAEIARENVRRNRFGERVTVVVADISAGGRVFHHAPGEISKPLKPGTFDHLVTNPPYYTAGQGTPPAVRSRADAHQMSRGNLDAWIAFLATAGTNGAELTMIHRADALGDLLGALDGRFGCIRICPIHPRRSVPATRVLIGAVKGSRAPLELRPGITLHDDDNRFVPDIDAVLRNGEPLRVLHR